MMARTWETWAVAAILVGLAAAPAAAQEAVPVGQPAVFTTVPGGPPPGEGVVPVQYDGRPPLRPDTFYLDGSYLFLKPRRRDEGSVESLHYAGRSAFRVGAGYVLHDGGWEVTANHTYLHSTDSRYLVAPPGGTLYATRAHPENYFESTAAAGLASANYNVTDLEIAQRLWFGGSFALRLAGGGRVAFIDQGVDVTYYGPSTTGPQAVNGQVSNPIEFEGAGVRLGAEGQWTLPWGLSDYARGYGSLVYGEFRTRYLATNNNGATVLANVTDQFEKMVPVAEYGVGLQYQVKTVNIRVGYEMSNWFGLVDAPDFSDGTHVGKIQRRTGDLSLDGLVVQFQVGF
jgi:hypothetical protein